MKSTSVASPAAFFSSWPKSNSGLSSSVSLIMAANGLPILLRNPCSGPTFRFVINSSISGISNWRLAAIFQRAKSHFSFEH